MAKTTPEGLGARGLSFWRRANRGYDFSASELELLTEVCRSLDELERMATGGKAAARDLRSLRVPYYLPQVVREERTPQGRKTRSVVPLFTSYLFLLGDHLVEILDHPLTGQ